MANKIKRISVNALERCVDNSNAIVHTEWNGLDVYVKRRLSLVEMMTFVDGVVKSCFSESDSQYIPEAKDFAIRCSLMEIYANFTLPANVKARYDIVYGCDACEMIMSNIDRNQFDAMMYAIDDKIDHAVEANIGFISRQINDMYAVMQTLEDQMGNMLSDVDAGTVAEFLKTLANGKSGAGKLTVVENSDNDPEPASSEESV